MSKKENTVVTLKTLKDFCNNANIKNYLSYALSIQIVDSKIDSKTDRISKYILEFYNNAKDKNNFFLNFNAIINRFYTVEKENITFISLSSVNRALQYINHINGFIFVIEFFHKNNETFFRVVKVGDKKIVVKKAVTSNELYEKSYKNLEKRFKSLTDEFNYYNANNKSLKKVEKYRKDLKEKQAKEKKNAKK